MDQIVEMAQRDSMYTAVTERGECAGVRRLVEMATGECPGAFTYGQLLECRAVRALEGTADEPSLRLLREFAYGTLQTYRTERSAHGDAAEGVPAIGPEQEKKLRQLTILSLAAASKVREGAARASDSGAMIRKRLQRAPVAAGVI